MAMGVGVGCIYLFIFYQWSRRLRRSRSGLAAVFISVTSSHLWGDVFINVPLPLINGPMETLGLTRLPISPPPPLNLFIVIYISSRHWEGWMGERRSAWGVIWRVNECSPGINQRVAGLNAFTVALKSLYQRFLHAKWKKSKLKSKVLTVKHVAAHKNKN